MTNELRKLSDVRAPFTPEQVAILNRFQTGGWFHPFTCGRRSEHQEDEGILVATVDGWQCPADRCSYRQDWAHGFMADKDFVLAGEHTTRLLRAGLDE